MAKKNKNIWNKYIKYILIGLTIVILPPIIVNFIMKIPCEWTIEGPQIWIGFWGTYCGAIASFIMAYIAYKQMKTISEQNRPNLYPTIEIFSDRRDHKNHYDYCLHIVNYGSRVASDIHIEIDGEVLNKINKKYKGNIDNIKESTYHILEKDDIVLKICPEQSDNIIKDENYVLWLEEFKKSSVNIKITYNKEYSIKKNISLSNTLYARTSSLQMLFYIKQSLDDINDTIKNKAQEML